MQLSSRSRRNIIHLLALTLAALFCLQPGNTGLNARSPRPNGPLFPLVTLTDAQLGEAVNLITTFQSRLEPRLWAGMELAQNVRQQAATMARTVADQLSVPGVVVDDIVTIGSLASYEYDKDADFDVHIFVGTDGYSGDIDVLKKYIAQFNLANAEKYKGITFYGYPVEFLVYAAAPSSQMAAGVGMYSILSGTWLSPPTQTANSFDQQKIFADSKDYIKKYNDLIDEFNETAQGFDCSRMSSLTAELRSYRMKGISLHGIRSTENLTYRMLRRLNINLIASLRQAGNQCTTMNASIY